MSSDIERLKANGIVMAHIEFTANGVLVVVFGFLVRELRLNPTALRVGFATLQGRGRECEQLNNARAGAAVANVFERKVNPRTAVMPVV